MQNQDARFNTKIGGGGGGGEFLSSRNIIIKFLNIKRGGEASFLI